MDPMGLLFTLSCEGLVGQLHVDLETLTRIGAPSLKIMSRNECIYWHGGYAYSTRQYVHLQERQSYWLSFMTVTLK